LVESQSGKTLLAAEIEQSLGLLKALKLKPLYRAIDALIRERQLDRQRILAPTARQSMTQGLDKSEEFGREHMAFAHVHHPMRSSFAEADQRAAPAVDSAQARPAPGARRREMDRRHGFGLQTLARGGIEHPIVYEAGQRLFIQMLELASSATAEMAARRLGSMRAGLHGAIRQHEVTRRGQRDMAARGSDAIALRGDANDRFGLAHKAAA
jgi:hypothetical protein